MSDDLVILCVWGLTPLAGMLVTLGLAWRTHRFLASASRAPGRIVRVTTEQDEVWRGEGQGRETVTTYTAHVEFAPAGGASVEFRSASLNAVPMVGQTVTVAYDPVRPESTARIDNPVVWRPTVLVAGLTIILSLFAIPTLWGQTTVWLPIAALAGIAVLFMLRSRL